MRIQGPPGFGLRKSSKSSGALVLSLGAIYDVTNRRLAWLDTAAGAERLGATNTRINKNMKRTLCLLLLTSTTVWLFSTGTAADASFNGLDLNLGNLSRVSKAKTRSIGPE